MCLCLVSLLILTLSTVASKAYGERMDRTNTESANSCTVGCAQCSEVNGCLRCDPNLYLLLQREFMSQKGVCVQSCPSGYFVDNDTNQKHNILKCHRCRIKHCDACHSKVYCQRCKPPFLEYKGSCISECPSGLHYANYTKDCLPKVDCLVGQWSNWSECSRSGKMCGFKYGWQSRDLEILQTPSTNGKQCPADLSEQQQCLLPKRRCSEEGGGSADGSGPPRAGSTSGTASERRANGRRQTRPASPSGAGAGENPPHEPKEYKKPRRRRPSKPLLACNSEPPDATRGDDDSGARCLRVRHGKESQTPSFGDEVSPTRQSDWKSGVLVTALDDPAAVSVTAAAIEAVTATSTAQPPRVTDVIASEYYSYYLALSIQLQRERSSKSSPSNGS